MAEENDEFYGSKKFFSNSEVLESLRLFNEKIKSVAPIDSTTDDKLNFVKRSLVFFLANPEQFDKQCQFNIQYLKEHFISLLNISQTEILSKINDIYATCYRFLTEFEFTTPGDLSFELSKLIRDARENINNLNIDNEWNQIFYATYSMPIQIAKFYMQNKKLLSVENFLNKIDLMEEKEQTWNSEYERRQEKIDALAQKLDKYEVEFNFVGLYQGFNQIAAEKVKEKDTFKHALIALGIVILLPLICELIYIWNNKDAINTINQTLMYLILPTVSLELILIYFFRVLLMNYKSVKTQLLQLELRKSLCQFIQNYGDYSAELKKKNDVVLDKFESLIFSGIITSEDQLPSSFDGIEQISNLIKSIKK